MKKKGVLFFQIISNQIIYFRNLSKTNIFARLQQNLENSQHILSNYAKINPSFKNMNKSQQNMFRQTSQSNSNPLNIFQTLFAANIIRNNLNFAPFTLMNSQPLPTVNNTSFEPDNEDKGTYFSKTFSLLNDPFFSN